MGASGGGVDVIKNLSQKLWPQNLSAYLCIPNKNGSIAQLVQSICLTSRGSAVRSRVLPQNESLRNYGGIFASVKQPALQLTLL